VIVGIHQPNFLPWFGFFYKISLCDVFVILDTVDIELGSAKSITHRTRIKTNTGSNWLSIPLIKSDSKIIKDVLINNSVDWKSKMLKTVYYQYRKSNHFDFFYTIFEEIINEKTEHLADLNIKAISKISNILSLNVPIIKSSGLNINSTDRNLRLIEICNSQDANIYISGKGGKKYNNEVLFQKNNIKIQYVEFNHPIYEQLWGDFIPNLSIIDLLFNCGKDSKNYF